MAVMGPQSGYYNQQLLWEAAVVSHGGTPYEFAARGITTVNLPYIVIGHGLAFAWSPTSASSDFTDTRVSKMCNTDGSQRSEEHTSAIQSLMRISYAVFCLKKKIMRLTVTTEIAMRL